MSIAGDIKSLQSDDLEKQLETIERWTKKRLSNMLGVSQIPSEFDYILFEVTNKRFNRIGQEGFSSYSQEGVSFSFPDSDFSEYEKEIATFLGKNTKKESGGSVTLL